MDFFRGSKDQHFGAELDSEISSLLRAVASASQAGNATLALRLADRAHRLAPAASEIIHIYCSLLIANGFASEASRILETAERGIQDAQMAAIDVEAALVSGDIKGARAKLDRHLSQFAVTRQSSLARIARRLIEQIGPECPGWIGVTPECTLIGDLRSDGSFDTLTLETTHDDQPPLLELLQCSTGWANENGLAGIEARDGLRISSPSWLDPAIGATISIPESFGLNCTVIPQSMGLSGKLRLSWLPLEIVPSLFAVSGKDETPISLESDPDQRGSYIFEVKSSAFRRWRRRTVDLHVRLPDGGAMRLYGSPYPLAPEKRYEEQKSAPLPQVAFTRETGIQILIPVYNGREETIACLTSVLTTMPQGVGVTVVDDASTDTQLSAYLDGLASDGRITLLRNSSNLGFPGTINRGIAHVPGNDIIILNSDTVVFPGWIERLSAHADKHPDYATITPLSNAGSIASYPKKEEPLCSVESAEERDALVSTTNAGTLIDAPTGVGFCMFMRRAAIDQLGAFEEELFSSGYGEENDFCMRARAHGWKHGIACDIYVLHRGGVSFGARKRALMERNGIVLARRHPSYPQLVEDFTARDPLAPFRHMLDVARLRSQKNLCLLVSLGLGGGVEHHVKSRIVKLTAEGFSPILVRPTADGAGIRIESDQLPGLALNYDADLDIASFSELLSSCTIEHLELHHFLGMPAEIIEACISNSPHFDIFIHDFSWYCPRLTLLGLSNRYCGEPEIKRCEQCVHLLGSAMPDTISVADLRARSAKWFRGARRIITASADTASRYQRQFPKSRFQIEPWEDTLPPITLDEPTKDSPLKIAVIGAIGEQKGYDFLLECARYAALRDLPVEFIVIGFTQNDQRLMQTGKVFVTGRYKDEEIPHLLQRECPAAAVYLSVTPETWCFSLSHAMRANLPILAFNHGAIAERLRESSVDHDLVELDITAQNLYRALVDLVGRRREKAQSSHIPILHSDPIKQPLALPSVFRSHLPIGVERMSSSDNVTATAEFLRLARGIYLFSVAPTEDSMDQNKDDRSLPALQISPAPGTRSGAAEFLGARTSGQHWLYRADDNVVLKVNHDSAQIVVTLITKPNLHPLQIDVQKLEGDGGGLEARQPAHAPAPPIAPMPVAARQPAQFLSPDVSPGMPPAAGDCLKAQVVVHVQNIGDMVFFDQSWAGAPDRKFAVEAFAITPMLNIGPEGIEYKCLMATGLESGWTSHGQPCGTRGLATPLLGFAVRPQNGSDGRFICEYSGRFASGKMIGPLRDGEMCTGSGSADYLEALWVRIVDQAMPVKEQAVTMPPSSLPSERKSKTEPVSSNIGPRFSIFREIDA